MSLYRIVRRETFWTDIGDRKPEEVVLPDEYQTRAGANNQIIGLADAVPYTNLVQHHAGLSVAYKKLGGYVEFYRVSATDPICTG